MRRTRIRGFDLIFHRHKKIYDAEKAAENTAPPGWYRDKKQGAAYRYWDGTAWTEHTADDLRFDDPTTSHA